MKKTLATSIILILTIQLAIQLAAVGTTFAAHSATVAWVKTQQDDPSYPIMPGAQNEYYWNGTGAKWISFTVTNNGSDRITEVKLVFQKYDNGTSMFDFNQTGQSKAGWYATPDEFGPDKRPTVLYFKTDSPSQYINTGETVTFSLYMTQGPEECRHNIDVWTIDAGNTPVTNFYELYILIDQHYPTVQITSPPDGAALYSPSIDVIANASDLQGPHLSDIKNATLRIDYNATSDPSSEYFTMKYNTTDGMYHSTLTEGSCLIDQAYHNCTVYVFDYAENGPVYSKSITFFWFKPNPPVYALTTDPCFLQNQPVGHVGGNATVIAKTGFKPNSTITATLGGATIGSNRTDSWGEFMLSFEVPEVPRNHSALNPNTTLPGQIVLTDDSTPPLTAECNFTIIPWMQIVDSNTGNVGDEVTVKGTGFAANATVNLVYRDVSLGNVYNTMALEWSDEATKFTWNPNLDNLTLNAPTSIRTNAAGTCNLTFNIPESYGGWHPIYGQEVQTGVRSGWMPNTVPPPSPHPAFPEAAFLKVMPKVWTEPTVGMGDQYVKIYATGLPLPEYSSQTIDYRTGQTTKENQNKTLALDFGPNQYWVFEKGFMLNNEFDSTWSQQLYLPFAYWFNHNDPTSPTWNGTLYWKDVQGEFHQGSQFLKVPVLAPGNCSISLYEFDRQTETDEKDFLATSSFLVFKDPLYVRVSSGTLYFKGENVTVYAEIDLDGTATNPTDISFQLYHEDSFLMSLTANPVSGADGLYTASFTCPQQDGNYFVKVNATKTIDGTTLNGFGVTSFSSSPTLDGFNATMTALNNGVATLNTNLGTMTLDLGNVNGNITNINGNVATITTDVGEIQTSMSTINGTLVNLDANVATIQTNLGTVKTTLDSLNAQITSIGADTVYINTTLGDVQGKITDVQGRTVDIQTKIGTVTTTTDSINSQTGLLTTNIALSLVAALAAIIAAVLIFRKLYK